MANSVASTTALSTVPHLFTSSPLLSNHHNRTLQLNYPLPKNYGVYDLKTTHKTSPLQVNASASAMPLSVKSDDLVESILSKVMQTDRGVLLTREEHGKVAELANELRRLCVDEPVKCPLIFGEWDVMYSSNPTSPGGGYRSAFGRLLFKTKEMIQTVEAPDIVRNKVSFSLLGLEGQVSLNGKLIPLDEKWIKVVFEPPELKIGGLEFKYGGQSEVKLEITYIDEKIRLGKGSRGTLFVFKRNNANS